MSHRLEAPEVTPPQATLTCMTCTSGSLYSTPQKGGEWKHHCVDMGEDGRRKELEALGAGASATCQEGTSP